MTIQITLKDGSKKTFPQGITPLEIAHSISPNLAKQVLIAKAQNTLIEVHTPLQQDTALQLLTWQDAEGKSTFWHSSAHIMAEALLAFFPNTKLGIGPAIENGFYYDVDLDGKTLSEDDIKKIEIKFLELSQQNNSFQKENISKTQAIEFFTQKNDPYKLDLLENLQDGSISFYTQGGFTDLCKGPHIPHTGFVKAFKILNLAGAYWRGDEKNKMLTRLYATSFPTAKDLTAHLTLLEEAKKRDHRKLGKELELFAFSEKVGMGLPLWLPKGAILRDTLQQFLQRKQIQAGYSPVITPHIGHKELYVTSGHYEKYGKDSFQPIQTPHEGETFFLKPMNCPHHCEIYKTQPRSYKDLPLRLAEFGTVYRYEQHGELHGLTRVRGFTQDDAHLFCRPDQVKEEFCKVIDLVLFVFKSIGFTDYVAQISLRDKDDKAKYIGTEENWLLAEKAIVEAAEEKNLQTVIEYGEAAFYGPKLDFIVRDAIGRKWQLGTIQVDYNLPERFALEYTDADNTKKRPVMIHRAPFGSMERFVALLIEHCAGNFPFWLAPTQITVLPISDKFIPYAQSLMQELLNQNYRAVCDERNEKIGKKIRDAEMQKVPYMFVVGEKEVEQNVVSVRQHGKGDLGQLSLTAFVAHLKEENANPQNG